MILKSPNLLQNDKQRFKLSLLLAITLHAAAAMILTRLLTPLPLIEPPQILQIALQAKQVAPTPMAQSKPKLLQKSVPKKVLLHKKRESIPIKTAVAPKTFEIPTVTSREPQAIAREQVSPEQAIGTSNADAISDSAPIAVAGPVSSPQFDTDYLSNPAPEYPQESRLQKEEGKVLLRILVDETGQPNKINLHRSSGFDRLDQASLAAVAHWKFIPGKQDGKPVAAWVVVPINFSLRK